jgi:hypothetical protein
MAAICDPILGMKLNIAATAVSSSLILMIRIILVWGALTLGALCGHAQQTLSGHASDFTSVEYFDVPNEKQMKTRLSGTDALPLPDNNGSVRIKNLKLETFNTNGTPGLIIEAPACVYDTVNNVANSAGPLQVRSADGRFRLNGVGFLWRQDDSYLGVSNQVDTVIKSGSIKFSAP